MVKNRLIVLLSAQNNKGESMQKKIILLSMAFPIHGFSLNDALESKGFHHEKRHAFLMLLRNTGALSQAIFEKEENDIKRKSLKQLALSNKSLLAAQDAIAHSTETTIDELGSKITFNSPAEAEAFLIAASQTLWFRSSWEKERADNAEALGRWACVDQSQFSRTLTPHLQTLHLFHEIKRPHDFKPDIIIWLGAIEDAAKPRIYADIPEGYAGEINVHSNRRGLFLTSKVMEKTGIIIIAQQLGLIDNEEAYEVIAQTCKDYTPFYEVQEAVLPTSTQELRKLIVGNLVQKGFLMDTALDFNWPTYKDLYTYLFNEAQANRPTILSHAQLSFDDPVPLPCGRIHTTESEAQYWLEQRKLTHPEEFNRGRKLRVLALSVQPFVKVQEENLKSVLADHCEVIAVGIETLDTPNSRKDALESLAKILFVQGRKNEAVKSILPWVS